MDSAGWVIEQASRGPAKMPVLGQRGQIPQLFQRDHRDKINLSDRVRQYD